MRNFLYHRLVLVSLIAVFITGNVYAFDKERKGFMVGIGLGPGFSSYKEKADSAGTATFDKSKSGLAFFSDFKIGYAPSNNLMIYWMSKGSWFGIKKSSIIDKTDDKNQPYEDVTALAGVGGLGITYFLKPQPPSLFVSVGGGFSAWSLPFEDTDAWTGIGVAGGLGYEFAKNWNLELSALWGKPKHDAGGVESTADPLAVGLTINVLGY